KLYANQEGMIVDKGDVLFEVYSPKLQLAADELISSQAMLDAAVAKASDSTGSMRGEAERFVATAKRKLQLLDIADEDIDAIAKAGKAPATIPIRSPADGHIVEKMVVQGSAVQAGMKLMRIEDHSRLWLD